MENVAEKEKMFIFGKRVSKKLMAIVAAVAIVSLGVGIFFVAAPNSDGKTTIITESTLKEVLEISELSTVEYTYNAITTKLKSDNEDEAEYYVAYEGTVTAGINFESIIIHIDEPNKNITITLPEVNIQRVKVEIDSLDFIFVHDKYETSTVVQDAYDLCVMDLKKRAEKEETFKLMAKENAVSAVQALFKPWIMTVDSEYEVVVQ